ncbi:MAG: TIGR02444 family protein [Rhodospirillaceae bacterium]
MADPGPDDLFWAFSLTLYGMPGIPAACLELQDHHGADVNMVLYLLWRARDGDCLDRDSMAALDEKLVSWRTEIIHVLRGMRRMLSLSAPAPLSPSEAAATRSKIKAAELAAEEAQQRAMALADPAPTSVGLSREQAGAQMLQDYASLLGSRFPSAKTSLLIETAASLTEDQISQNQE